jgi:type IV pilus assembly protein PilB
VVKSSKKRLVIIDDDANLRDELSAFFAASYQVATYPGTPATLKALRDAPPDALLIDLDLQGIKGFDVLRLMQSTPELRPTPVVVLSASNDFETFEQAHRLGIADFVAKPFRVETLGEKLALALDKRHRRVSGRLKLGALLVQSGLVSQAQLDEALEHQQREGGRLGENLVKSGRVSEEDLSAALAGQMHIKVVDLRVTTPVAAAVGLLPRDFIVRHRVLPIRIHDDGAIELAMTNPLDIVAIDEVRLRTKRRVIPVIVTESAFDEAITIFTSKRGKLRELDDESGQVVRAEEIASAQDASTIEIVDSVISDAVGMKASDIHIEPREDVLQIRCRIDGVLHDLREYPLELQPGVLSRLKIMGSMDIAERRLPQDGRISFMTADDEPVDLRVASIPSLYGENITIRILEVSPLPPTLSSLGLSPESLERYEGAIKRPDGGIVICGPTGCGKSTTLYTTLELIKSKERKIYTVEDPIERKLAGIVQTETRPIIGLTFAQALRALVRADPDVIMVGEIRDLETAKMAADAAITGHLVFTTMHTQDASSGVYRLIEMGLPAYLVAAAFRCVVAQRLLRRLCRHCRKQETMTEAKWRELGWGDPPAKKINVWTPVGCPKCFGTGYYGRLGLYEVMTIDDDMRNMISAAANVNELRLAARARNVESIRDDGLRKVLDGSTSYLELLRVTT